MTTQPTSRVSLIASVIQARLRAQGLAAPVTVWDRIGSTQDGALAGLRAGASHGAVYAAERQTDGRGRRGRRWLTTPGGLLFSVVTRTCAAPRRPTGRLTMAAVVGVARAIQACTGASASIKWPNDLMFAEAKAGGVLLETYKDAAVIGVGLNLLSGAGMAEGQATTAIAAYATRAFDRNELLATCVVRVLDCLTAEGAAWDAVYADWVGRSTLLGRQVEVSGALRARGSVEGFEPDGALRLRDANGNLRLISSGDVSLRLMADVQSRHP
ncbi:MAG: biotin--[acetyl-CoA-carboxylase] ligase [Chloroflexi bacterium]|nr:biotin--[acetyl-CoA-carboxylase] ligase [Chloroflexota bacterium]